MSRWLRNRKATRKALAMRQRTRELGERRILECRFESAVRRAHQTAPKQILTRPDEVEALWDAVDAAGKLLRLERR